MCSTSSWLTIGVLIHFPDDFKMPQKPLYKCWTKATNREIGEPRYSVNWIIARRGQFKISENELGCGNWKIPFNEVEKVTVYKIKTFLGVCKFLHITTREGANYQFAFNPWAKPLQYLPLKDIEEKEAKLGYSMFSIVVRISILIVFARYLLIKILEI